MSWFHLIFLVTIYFINVIQAERILVSCHQEQPKIVAACPPRQMVNITFANFGRTDKWTCPGTEEEQIDDFCKEQAEQYTKDAMRTCFMKSVCTIRKNSGYYEPCEDVLKYLEVRFTCLEGPSFESLRESGTSTKEELEISGRRSSSLSRGDAKSDNEDYSDGGSTSGVSSSGTHHHRHKHRHHKNPHIRPMSRSGASFKPQARKDEEDKEDKGACPKPSKGGTTACAFIIVLLIFTMGGMVFYHFRKPIMAKLKGGK